jgi:putative hemolysin
MMKNSINCSLAISTLNNMKKTKTIIPLSVRLAESVDEMKLAQRLRAEAFGPAFGVQFESGFDEDRFDVYCAHLLVFEGSRLVATTRLLDRARASLAGGFYSEQEFDLKNALDAAHGNILEIGRTCVAPDYSSMRAIQALWQGVAEVTAQWNTETLIGCASIPLGDGDCQGWLDALPEKHRLTLPIRARHKLPQSISHKHPEVPTLLKTYLRMNARLGAQACFDPVFHCADVLIWLSVAEMTTSYRERLIAV